MGAKADDSVSVNPEIDGSQCFYNFDRSIILSGKVLMVQLRTYLLNQNYFRTLAQVKSNDHFEGEEGDIAGYETDVNFDCYPVGGEE